jgi:hypothetical protein
MTVLIGQLAFTLLLLVSLGGVATGALYLVVILIKEWRSGDLW